MRRRRLLRLALPLASTVSMATLGALALRASERPAARHALPAPVGPGAIWQLTYLKAHPGASVDSLARVVQANWFAMDAQAVAAGDLAGYHLLRGSAADTSWDLLEIAVFRDSLQHARADSLYRVRYRPAHRAVLVGGRDLSGWGRIVRSEPLRYLSGDAATLTAAPLEQSPSSAAYVWQRLTPAADFPTSYNFPVHVAPDGRFVALHPRGTWISRDGITWTRGSLPFSGMNSAYLPYVQHDGATWALGVHEGNYQRFTLDPVIKRTSDYRAWTTVGRSATLPKRVFSAAASFRGAMWLLGGYDGRRESAEVWRSSDGMTWELVVANAPWGPRMGSKAVVFRDRLFLLGGGALDGPSANDVWSSTDGVHWERETTTIANETPVGYAPIVFDGQLWLVGANRSGRFTSEMLVSTDGRTWRAASAPWSARGGVAVWTDGRAMFLTGGKSSREERGETIFSYSNDVWQMRAAGDAGRR